MDSQVLLVVGLGAIGGAIALAVLILVSASVGRTGVARALETIDRVYAPGSAAAAEEDLRTRALAPAARRLGGVANALTPRGLRAWLQRWLDYAGNPPAWPPERIVEMQGVGLLAGGALAALLGAAAGAAPTAVLGLLIVGAAVGFAAPLVVVYDVGLRRQEQIRRTLPDAMDLLTVSVEAGLGLDAAMAQVARTMPGPLSREFARMLQEMQMGQRRSDALRAMAARSRVAELRTMVSSVVQATELGIPIGHVLREQAAEIRLRRRQRAEEQARKVPVKIVFPLVLCLFPALFIVVIGPGVLNIMEALFNR
ncbi:MAG: type II secretion system F family protein [Micromonosporaceae bacterium]